MGSKEIVELRREEFLNKLRSLINAQEMLINWPSNRGELEKVLREIGYDEHKIPENILKDFLNNIDYNKIDELGFLSFDGYLRKQADYLIKVIPNDIAGFLRENVSFGSVLINEINGLCIKVPTGGYVVLINSGSIKFFRVLSDLITSCLNFDTPSGELKPILSYDEVVDIIRKIAVTYPYYDPENIDRDRFTFFQMGDNYNDNYRARFSTHLCDNFANFLIAHEVGHIVCGHLSGVRLKAISFGNESMDAVDYSWDQEYDADMAGADIFFKFANDNENQFLRFALPPN